MKRSMKSLILLGVLTVLLGGYTAINWMPQKSEVSEEAGSFAIMERSEGELTGISWTNNGEECHFEKDGDSWRNVNDPSFPTDHEAVQEMADRLLSIKADRKLSNVEHPEDYGFGEDSYAVTAEWSDGEITRYILGDETPFGDGYYLRIEGEEGVIYTSSSSLSAMFAETLVDLAVLEEIPAVENAVQLIIGTKLDLAYQKTSISIDPNQHWYGTDDGEPMDDDAVEALLQSIEALEWSALVSIGATEAELAEWQLNDEAATRIIVLGEDGEKLELFIGIAGEGGEYYARLSGSSMVYALPADSVASILDSDAEQLFNPRIFPLEYEDVRLFSCELNGSALEYRPAPADEAGDSTPEGNNFQTESGDSGAEEDISDSEPGSRAQEAWNRIHSLTAAGHCTEAPAGDPLLTISVTSTSGVCMRCSFHDYSEDFYQISTDEGRSLLVSADEADKLIRFLRQ